MTPDRGRAQVVTPRTPPRIPRPLTPELTDHALQGASTVPTDAQRQAVEWQGGPLLVLAAPGSGTTRVLTRRIVHLLDAFRDRRFRILALTVTDKAAHEMTSRVTTQVPGFEERVTIDTFHGFCAQVLRQHGAHLGIKPDFAVYPEIADRQAVLGDALRRSVAPNASDAPRILPWIDGLKEQLVEPEQAERHLAAENRCSEDPGRVARAYRLYEDELRCANALDFHSLILEAYRLFAYPALARHYRTSHRYWLIDEFQNTNGARYALLRRMVGGSFREIYVVADDERTFERSSAKRRIGDLVRDFGCNVIRLSGNAAGCAGS